MLQLTALPLLRLVRIVKTVVVSIADVDPGDAVAIVASEQVSVAGPVGGGALISGLILTTFAIAVAVAIPRGRNAAVIGTTAEKSFQIRRKA